MNFDHLLLEHNTNLQGLIGIFDSHALKTPKKRGVESWSPNYIFFRFVKNISNYSIGIYLDPNEILTTQKHMSFFIHPTSNIFDILNSEPKDCYCSYEYISPKLKTKLLIENKQIIEKCSLKSLRQTMELMAFDYESCDGGNEIGFNQDISINMIRIITINEKDFLKLPKRILNMFIHLDINIIFI